MKQIHDTKIIGMAIIDPFPIHYIDDNDEEELTYIMSQENYRYSLTDTAFAIYFDNDLVLYISTVVYSMGTFDLTSIQKNSHHLKKITNVDGFRIEEYNEKNYFTIYEINEFNHLKIVDVQINGFSEEYQIDVEGTTRPANGDYYKEIFLIMDNGQVICLAAKDIVYDGFMDIFYLEKMPASLDFAE